MNAAWDPPAVSITKRKFLEAYPKPVPGIYDAVLQELLVQQHLIRYNKKYQYNPVRPQLLPSHAMMVALLLCPNADAWDPSVTCGVEPCSRKHVTNSCTSVLIATQLRWGTQSTPVSLSSGGRHNANASCARMGSCTLF